MRLTVVLSTAILLGFGSLAANEPPAHVLTAATRAHLAVQSVRLVDNGYLVREYNCCNPGCRDDSYSTGSMAEAPGAGGDRDEDIALDPDHCPEPWETP